MKWLALYDNYSITISELFEFLSCVGGNHEFNNMP
ncbi:hypothetical protein BA6E_10313 [Bacteroidales bacterium 6E]|nr:hypothetical protein BA6E_10313 [Bacteroidales bacterium 6E]